MIITSADFITSAVKPDQYPAPELPEAAFAGRSNVGKSSLINTLVNRKRLVKTGSTPGRTQLINFFRVNAAFHLVDLPGYGYAKVPAAVQRKWGPMVETYITGRACLKTVVVIMDLRRRPKTEEMDLFAFLAHHAIDCIPVLTKADKLTRQKQAKQQKEIARILQMDPAGLLMFSAKTRQGKQALWQALEARLLEPKPDPGPEPDCRLG